MKSAGGHGLMRMVYVEPLMMVYILPTVVRLPVSEAVSACRDVNPLPVIYIVRMDSPLMREVVRSADVKSRHSSVLR